MAMPKLSPDAPPLPGISTLYKEAEQIIRRTKNPCPSALMREMRVSYSLAATLLDLMFSVGILKMAENGVDREVA
jgi:hypothetical protein